MAGVGCADPTIVNFGWPEDGLLLARANLSDFADESRDIGVRRSACGYPARCGGARLPPSRRSLTEGCSAWTLTHPTVALSAGLRRARAEVGLVS